VNQPPEWPPPNGGPPPAPSPYQSVLSDASSEFAHLLPAYDEPEDDEPEATAPPAAEPAPAVAPSAMASPQPTTQLQPATQPQPATPNQPALPAQTAYVATARVPGAPVQPWQAPDPTSAPAHPPPMMPHRGVPMARPLAVPRITSGPPARAVSGPPSRVAAAASGLPFPGVGTDRPRTNPGGTAGSESANAPRRIRGMIAFVTIVVLVLGLGLTGYFWALPVYGETHSTLVAPNDLIGLKKVTDPTVYADVGSVNDNLRTLGINSPLVIVYLASDDPSHRVIFAGGTHTVWLFVGNHLDYLFTLMARENDLAITAVGGANPGPLGGVAKCGRARADGSGQLAVCGWQDHGTIALLFFANRTPQEGAILMRAMRPALQHRTG